MKLSRFSTLLLTAIMLLLMSGLLYTHPGVWRDEEETLFKRVEQRVTGALDAQERYMQKVANNYSEGAFRVLGDTEVDYPTFVFVDGRLQSWSSNQYVPDYREVQGEFAIRALSNEHGFFVVRKQRLAARGVAVEIISLLILERRFEVANRYLRDNRNELLVPTSVLLHDTGDETGHDLLYEGQPIFNISFEESRADLFPVSYLVSFLLFLAGLSLLIVLCFRGSGQLAAQGRFVLGMLTFMASLMILRAALIVLGLPAANWNFFIFDDRVYYSSPLNASLGELLLNLILLLVFLAYLIKYLPARPFKKWLGSQGLAVRWCLALGFLSISFCGLWIHELLITSLSTNSQVILDITESLIMGNERLAAITIFLFGGIIILIVNQFALFGIKSLGVSWRLILTLSILIYLITLLTNWGSDLWWLFPLLHLPLTLSAFFWNWPDAFTRLNRKTFVYLTSSTLVSAILISASLYKSKEKETLDRKEKFANQLLIENDVLGEYLLSEIASGIKADVQVSSRFLNPKIQTDLITAQIRQQYISEYFDKYDVGFVFYDKDGSPISETNILTFEDQQESLNKTEYQTEYEGIYFQNDPALNGLYRYSVLIPINRYATSLGFILMQFQLKRFIPSSIYPELLVDDNLAFTPRSDFDYAFYQDGNLVYEAGDYNYSTDFDLSLMDRPELYLGGLEDETMHHLGIMGGSARRFVITSAKYANRRIFANFSFYFLSFVFLIGLFFLFTGMKPGIHRVNNFAARLQIYLGIAFFLPLLVTSVVVLNTISTGYKERLDQEYRTKAENVSQFLSEEVENYLSGNINKIQLAELINSVSGYSQSDINLFDDRGMLITSSQPRVFDEKLISRYLNPNAFYQIIAGEKESFTFDEHIGELQYRSAYHALRSGVDGRLLGTMSIPFFESTKDLTIEELDIFTSLLNIFTLIFLISLIVVNLASSVITQPLSLIAKKLGRTNLDGKNQPIDWKSNDEIGVLVQEYNRMLINLERSKETLAKNEKELAWREMAKQVAHEIKNPLTPMKLTLQQLERKVRTNEKTTSEEALKPISTVLHQIDTLSDIATSFSAFAKMPLPVNEPITMNSVLSNVVGLFEEKCKIELKMPHEEIAVFTDGKLLGRILNNLILNGIQAVPEERKPIISVTLSKSDNLAILQIKDNGTGIPEALQPKIFVPNFSTKSTGSGLGLAIAKRGIEHAGGTISFTTEVGQGTVFKIELPLYQ